MALQGDFQAHRSLLESLGAQVKLVRASADLADLDGLLLPGGESTVMSRLCERYELFEPLRHRISAGLPTFGTCAGLIFLAQRIEGASDNFAQKTLEMLDVSVARNAYGAQIESFETDLPVAELGGAVRAVFIRAPRIESVGEGVEVLASWQDAPVLVRQGAILALSFHPEIAGETRIHQMWLDSINQSRETPRDSESSSTATQNAATQNPAIEGAATENAPQSDAQSAVPASETAPAPGTAFGAMP